MNNSLEDWLNQLESETHIQPPSPSNLSSDASQPQDPEPATLQPQTLTTEDFDDILDDFGFIRPEDADAEEIVEEETPTVEEQENSPQNTCVVEAVAAQYPENMNGRNLDAEEDADWEQLMDAGVITSVNAGDEMPSETPADSTSTASVVEEDAVTLPQQSETILPLNSPTLLLDESTSRFSGTEWFNLIQRQSIILAGVGGIGSNLVFQLARMHPQSIVMYDADTVEAVNMSGQLFSRTDIGKSKVSAMSDMIGTYTNAQNIYAINQWFTEHTEAGNVMMCGFDSMAARRTFFKAWVQHVGQLPTSEERKKCLFLDGRLSIDCLQVLCLTGDDSYNIVRYEKEYLFSDEEADHTVCSMKQTTYLACMIGAMMTNLFTNWVANLLEPVIPYNLPFFTEYDARNMIFKLIK